MATFSLLSPRDLRDIRRRVRMNEAIRNTLGAIPGLLGALALIALVVFASTAPVGFEDWGEAIVYTLTHNTPGP